MSRIGIILSVHEAADQLNRFIKPWLEYQEKYKNHEIIFSIVHACFKENHEAGAQIYSQDGTMDILGSWWKKHKIEFYNILDVPASEHDARNVALVPLISAGCDYILSTAPDEFFEVEQIDRLFNYIVKDPFIAVYRINYKNLVFTSNQWIDGFCPNRIWKVISGQNHLIKFNYDDNTIYEVKERGPIQDGFLSCKIVPKEICWPIHETWLDNERSHKKVLYQRARWGKDGCSFDWKNDHLVFSLDYYKRIDRHPPIINREK